jgi:hypothetical protein
MWESMTVHPFRVESFNKKASLSTVLNKLQKTNLEDRTCLIGGSQYRIEHISKKKKLWKVDIGKLRAGSGPGAASKNTPTRGFKFKAGEQFCEETAFLYDESTKHLVLQYNHYGTRSGALQDYINFFGDDLGFTAELIPVYDSSANERFNSRKATKKLDFKVDVSEFTVEDKVKGTALEHVLNMADKNEAMDVSIVLSATRSKKGILNKAIDKTAELLKAKAEDQPDSVKRLRVGVLQDERAEKMDLIDLLSERKFHRFEKLKLGDDRRISRTERYDSIKLIFDQWKKDFK